MSRSFALLPLLVASLAAAQDTAVLTGAVVDPSSAPLADAVVTASAPELPQERVATTDAAGLFRLTQLPAGTYTLRVTRAGFATLTRPEVVVRADRTVRVNVQLEAARAEAAIADAGSAVAPTPAPTATQPLEQGVGLGVTSPFLDRVPFVTPNATGQRSAESVVRAAPQVVADRFGFGVSGGTSAENLYLLDGLRVNDPRYGSLRTPVGVGGALLPLEFLEAVNVTTGAAPLEAGRHSGGVVSLVTKSGTNEWRGSVWGTWWPGALTATSKPFSSEASALEVTTKRHNTGDFGAEVGGALVKDRLFVYAGLAQAVDRQRVSRSVRAFLLSDDGSAFLTDASGALRTERLATTSRFDDRKAFTWLGKLTWRLDDAQTLALTVTGSPQERRAPAFAPLTSGTVLDTTNATTTSLRYTGAFLDQRLLVDATAGWSRTEQAHLPGDGSLPGQTTGAAGDAQTTFSRALPFSANDFGLLPDDVAARCEPAGVVATKRVTVRGVSRFVLACPVTGSGASIVSGGPGLLQSSEADRLQARANASYRFTLLGHHVARAGADVEWTQVRLTKALSGGVLRVDQGATVDEWSLTGADPKVPLRVATSSPSQLATGLFLQDSWNVLDAVTLTGGLRYDAQQLFTSDGRLALALNSMLSPRVGVAYDFSQRGRSRLFANYAVYQQTVPLELVDRALEPGGRLVMGSDPSPSTRAVIDPALKPMSKSELTAGLEYEVLPALRVGLVGTHSWLVDTVELMSADGRATTFLGNPGSGLAADFTKPERKYFAATLFGSKAFTSGWLVQGSYTLSSLWGNTAGLVQNDGSVAEVLVASQQANRSGPLPGDRTHQLKAYVAKDFELSSTLSLMTGVSYEGLSGAPINYLARDPSTGTDDTFVLPRGSAGRTPWTHTVNVRAALQWKLSQQQALQVSLDVFNLFNLQEPTEVSQQLSSAALVAVTPPEGKDPAEAACLSGNSPTCQTILKKQVGAAQAPVTAADLNTTFKQPTAYQQPLSVRLGVKLSF